MSDYLELTPARAKAKSGDKLWGRGDLIAEEKMNGWRFLMHFGGGLDRTYMTGRRTSKVTLKLSEKGLCAPCLWPAGLSESHPRFVLDGEVMPPPGANFRDMASIMNADPETAAKTIQRLGQPTYQVFDILFMADEDVRERCMIERKGLATGVVKALGNPLIQMVPSLKPEKAEFDRIVAAGGEGLILKDISDAYGEGWYKVKKSTTLDVIVTGFTDARFGRTGKYDGQIGAVKVSVYSTRGEFLEVAQVSGMTDDVRLHMTHNKGEWMGKVVEIEAQEWAKDRLAHPRYVRERPEAEPRSCTFSKMMEDLKAKEPEDEEQPTGQGSLF